MERLPTRFAVSWAITWIVCLSACGSGPDSPANPSPTLTAVAIQGLPAAFIEVGQTAQARAMGTYSDGTTRDVTPVWSSTNLSVLSVSPSGLVMGVGVGAAEVVATVSGVAGRQGLSVRAAAGSDEPFRVAILTATAAPPAASDITRVFARAIDILFEKTGARMEQVSAVNAGPGNATSLAAQYLMTLPTPMPDGVLALADDETATSFGGYSTTTPLPSPFLNRFPSPFRPPNSAYVAVVDFVHKYARCGYDNAGNRIGDRASGGECRNQTGLLCVDNGRYWQCPDTLTDLYSQPDVFPACTIVHEFMHPFGPLGNFDHYGTQQCRDRTGMSAADSGDRRKFQQNCGMCPDVYLNFRR
jgi:hypothetical protein